MNKFTSENASSHLRDVEGKFIVYVMSIDESFARYSKFPTKSKSGDLEKLKWDKSAFETNAEIMYKVAH